MTAVGCWMPWPPPSPGWSARSQDWPSQTQGSGGADNDTLTGGDADDQGFGQSGDDRMVWNPGDDTAKGHTRAHHRS
jgi:hypothetical protein